MERQCPFSDAQYYPRTHVVSDGRVFMTGPLNLTQFLNTTKTGHRWEIARPTQGANALMEYAPSVHYDKGKIVYIGGGQGPPSNAVKTIDLNQLKPVWQDAKSNMAFPRRQHNATILPDGTVLVSGGTMGSGGPNNGFNDLSPGRSPSTRRNCGIRPRESGRNGRRSCGPVLPLHGRPAAGWARLQRRRW